MGFFSFFTKKNKETLDSGLSKTKESVFSKISKAIIGKSKVDEDVLDNLEEILIESDVGVETTYVSFIIIKSLLPHQLLKL